VLVEEGAQDRFVFFSPVTCHALRNWLSEKPSSEMLFVWQTGHKTQPVPVKPLKPSGVHEILKRLAKRAGVTHRHNAHSLRHGFARDYLLNGGDLGSLSDILGHHDIETTRTYAVFLVDHLKTVHQRYSPLAHLENQTPLT
jgi:site-specific recombinase XerD